MTNDIEMLNCVPECRNGLSGNYEREEKFEGQQG